MSKVSFFTDLHIGVHQNSEKWLKIALDWSKWFSEENKKRGITDIFFGGDLFHYRDEINVKTLYYANLILENLKDFNITMITGNHDIFYKNTSDINSLRIINNKNNIVVFDAPELIEKEGRKIMLCPWGTEYDDIANSDINLCHFEIDSFKVNSFKVWEGGFKANDLLKKTDLLFSGHFHVRSDRKYKGGRIIYAGNPFEMDFTDSKDKKGFYIIDLDNLNYEFIHNNKSPNHIKINLSGIDFNKIKIDKNSIVKLFVDEDIDNDKLDLIIQKIKSFDPINVITDYFYKFSSDDVDFDSDFDVNTEEYIREYIDNVIEEPYKKDTKIKVLDTYKKFV